MKHTSPARVAIVGAGGIARGSHLRALRAQGEAVSVVAVVDVDAERAGQLATEAGATPFADVHQMLAEQSPDLVVVATPPSAHLEASVAALDAGAWVWCEKPPTLSLSDYDEIVGHEGQGGPYASYVFQHRFGSAAARLRQQVADATLGRPLVGVCHTLWYRDHDYFAVPWRGRWETEGGGPNMGHGIHQMDLMLSVLGDWREVTAVTATLDRDVETEDVAGAVVTMESGAVVSVMNSLLSPRQSSYLRFDFADATVEVEHLYGYRNQDWTWTPAPHVGPERAAGWAPDEDLPSSHAAQLSVLLEHLDRGERPPASGSDGRRVLELIAAIYQSAAQRHPVRRSELVADNPYLQSMSGRPLVLTPEVARA